MRTRFADFFGIDHPIISAPMASVSGGKLAAAVTSGGGADVIVAQGGQAGGHGMTVRSAADIVTDMAA